MRARDYDSGTGRFTAVDPLPSTASTHLAVGDRASAHHRPHGTSRSEAHPR
ncbi:hypothetical protein [Streptomyces sp. NRRL WC-3618]|uniref:hypothetical protein n=1 Tax=Streptomyces sp. NRRL WC-3618 TaxID=1519490 RepID=UPI003B638FE8